MDKGKAHIMGELEFETGNIEVRFEGKVLGHIVLAATIIKNISEKTGISTTKIMKDITTVLESGGLVIGGWKDKPCRTADERTEEE